MAQLEGELLVLIGSEFRVVEDDVVGDWSDSSLVDKLWDQVEVHSLWTSDDSVNDRPWIGIDCTDTHIDALGNNDEGQLDRLVYLAAELGGTFSHHVTSIPNEFHFRVLDNNGSEVPVLSTITCFSGKSTKIDALIGYWTLDTQILLQRIVASLVVIDKHHNEHVDISTSDLLDCTLDTLQIFSDRLAILLEFTQWVDIPIESCEAMKLVVVQGDDGGPPEHLIHLLLNSLTISLTCLHLLLEKVVHRVSANHLETILDTEHQLVFVHADSSLKSWENTHVVENHSIEDVESADFISHIFMEQHSLSHMLRIHLRMKLDMKLIDAVVGFLHFDRDKVGEATLRASRRSDFRFSRLTDEKIRLDRTIVVLGFSSAVVGSRSSASSAATSRCHFT
ncbi:hypothetical protein GCK72_008894 [Caenorhabditis remanei]|uniref:Uncharacterized protein n=1 Tax=Caenorhabditis remanei TaxID=31234 RepID=A0A6A5H166_CAERE|nr:hypothetical protein GCK72_008894 [Caenorhabditis remanei]KAF1760645.1 hypothetical protein GCK72_008894 [Caenorhabditis remanei]